jgi:hypothetical protein
LLAIADVIGSEWPTRLREIALNIMLLEASEDPSAGVRLLSDIRDILGDRDWVTSGVLVAKLNAGEWHVSGKSLANKLKPYGIEPRQERHGDRVERGYLAADFADAFSRYLNVPLVPFVPAAEDQKQKVELASVTSGTSGTTIRKRKLA